MHPASSGSKKVGGGGRGRRSGSQHPLRPSLGLPALATDPNLWLAQARVSPAAVPGLSPSAVPLSSPLLPAASRATPTCGRGPGEQQRSQPRQQQRPEPRPPHAPPQRHRRRRRTMPGPARERREEGGGGGAGGPREGRGAALGRGVRDPRQARAAATAVSNEESPGPRLGHRAPSTAAAAAAADSCSSASRRLLPARPPSAELVPLPPPLPRSPGGESRALTSALTARPPAHLQTAQRDPRPGHSAAAAEDLPRSLGRHPATPLLSPNTLQSPARHPDPLLRTPLGSSCHTPALF